MKITRESFKNIVRETMIEENEYQEFFKKALEKTGKSIPDMSDEEKKDFFNKIDSAWKGRGEKKNEGNAFGAAVSDAKEKGEDEFEVGGEKFKVESVNEALLPADTKVVKSFFDKKPLEGRNLNTDGKVLKTAGIGSQEMYIHTPKGVKMVGKITGKYAQSLVQFVNKNYRSDLVESVNEASRYIAKKDAEHLIHYLSGKKAKDVLSFIFKIYNFKSDKAKKEMAQAFIKYQDGVLDKKGLETAFFDIDKKYGMRESVTEGKKVFKVNPAIGKSKYSISSHDGVKKHKDGSDFFDIETFKNKVDLEKAIKNYTSKGFKMESVNEEIKVGQMVKVVDNPHWEAALGKKGPFKRKVKGIYGDSVFFTDGSNSSMKYVKESVESVNEDTKKRFDVDFYKGNGDKQTSHEEIIRGDKFSDVVSQATKVAKSKGMNYVELYYKDAFIGSIDKKSNYTFKKGRNSEKSPLSVNEDFKAVVGKTIFSDGKGKLFFGYYKEDDSVHFVDYKTWKKLSFKDVSKGDTNKDSVIKAILKNQKQFNKSVEYNMWSKKNNPSFEQKMDWFIQNGWISNINKGGIKESIDVSSVNEEKYTVIDPKGNQLGTAGKNQVAMFANKKGGAKAGYFVVANKNALKARRALEKFKGDFKNPQLKDIMADLYYESVKK
jgi:hypothetical protein